MQRYTVTAKVEKATADRLHALAAAKRIPVGDVAGLAIELYISLPDELRSVLHSLTDGIRHDETPYIMKGVVRSLSGLDVRRRSKDLDAIHHDLLP